MGLFIKKNEDLLITVLRFAGGSVFLWFGLDKILDPAGWYGWMPPWLWGLLPFSPDTFMTLLGSTEFVAGLLMVLGRFMRIATVFAIAHLAGIIAVFGANETTVRDASLVGIYLALFVHANRDATRQVPKRVVAGAVTAYLFLVLALGVLFIR